ncbi:hypothetical protein KGY79_04785 [Candidatus Bipolaricaulota bacterium]|nr:hypothetical protein [Candidatus Bipolaricaulota bacterium]
MIKDRNFLDGKNLGWIISLFQTFVISPLILIFLFSTVCSSSPTYEVTSKGNVNIVVSKYIKKVEGQWSVSAELDQNGKGEGTFKGDVESLGSLSSSSQAVKVPIGAVKLGFYDSLVLSKSQFWLSKIRRNSVKVGWLENTVETESDSNQGNSNGLKDNEVKVHGGDLIVKSGENLTLEDQNLLVEGDLIFKRNSQFTLKNSTIMVLQEYKSQHKIEMRAESSGRIINSTIEPVKGVHERYESFYKTQLMFSTWGKELEIVDSEISARINTFDLSETIIRDSRISYVYWTPVSELSLENTEVGSFVFDYKYSLTEGGEVSLEGLRPGEKSDLSLTSKEGGSLNLAETVVERNWHINLELPRKEVTVRDSNIEMIWLKFPPSAAQARIKLPKGHIDRYTLGFDYPEPGLPYNLELVDTYIEQFKLETFGANMAIESTKAMVHPYAGSDIEIRDSVAHAMNIYGMDRVKIIDSKVVGPLKFGFKPELEGGYQIYNTELGTGGTGNLIFDDAKLVNVPFIKMFGTHYEIEGDVKIFSPDSFDKVEWVKGTIKRSYPVIVRGAEGNTISNAKIRLLNTEGETVQELKTDSNGQASFPITFDKENYDNRWKVAATYPGGQEISKELGFLTSTPVVISTKEKL